MFHSKDDFNCSVLLTQSVLNVESKCKDSSKTHKKIPLESILQKSLIFKSWIC